LFDGNRARLNIGHECVDRHESGRTAIRVARDDGTYELATFGELRDWSNQFANWLIAHGIQKGDSIAIMLERSLTFYLGLYGEIKVGAVQPLPSLYYFEKLNV
jgi:acetyl-CoA synthetase